ncbi:hypothetical protein ACLKA6_006814 [Drosophila palustris]
MDQWTGVHRAFIIRAYYRNNDSISSAQRMFKKQFSIYQVPPTNVIKSWLRHFECTGSSQAGSSISRSSLPTLIETVLSQSNLQDKMLPWYRLSPKSWFHNFQRDRASGEFFKCTLLFCLGILLLKRLGRGLPSLKIVETYLTPKKS